MTYKKMKDVVVEQIKIDLKKDKRAIVRGLGTFKIVKYKAKKTTFGIVKARTNIKFKAEPQLRQTFAKVR